MNLNVGNEYMVISVIYINPACIFRMFNKLGGLENIICHIKLRYLALIQLGICGFLVK